jgi:A/G-specific adenine glycosylase
LTQILVRDVWQGLGDAGGRRRIGTGGGWLLTTPQGSLSERKAPDGLPAEEPVDPLEDDGRQMLDFERRRTFNAKHQRRGFRRFLLCAAWPGDLERLAMSGNLRADDVRPAGDDLGRGKALRAESLAQGGAEQFRKRPGKTARGFGHRHTACGIVGVMSVAAQLPRRKKAPTPEPAELLAWYDRHARVLPWRALRGEHADPYRVWLSEIMLQQTTVKAVAPYYIRFLSRWPTVDALAAASLDDVLRAWAGLGYYARARNLHACAKAIVEQHSGHFPRDRDALRALPGIGDYTAAAIAAIAFDRPAVPVDGNVERVVSRLFAVEDEPPAAKPAIKELAASLLPSRRVGDFAQALMDLGATICSPKRPACALCPWNDSCLAKERGDQEMFPRKAPKREGRLRRGAAFVALRADGRVLLRRRPNKGLLASMMEVPGSAWAHDFDDSVARRSAPRLGGKVQWRRLHGVVQHVFTHFPLEVAVFAAQVPRATPAPKGARWVKIAELRDEALPNVMRKVLAHALDRG